MRPIKNVGIDEIERVIALCAVPSQRSYEVVRKQVFLRAFRVCICVVPDHTSAIQVIVRFA
jgi:hypothetical protein